MEQRTACRLECRFIVLIQGVVNSAQQVWDRPSATSWNCPAQQITPVNTDMTVQGDFRLVSSGTGSFAITNDNNSRTLSISGNYYQEGGILDFNAGSTITAVSSYLMLR